MTFIRRTARVADSADPEHPDAAPPDPLSYRARDLLRWAVSGGILTLIGMVWANGQKVDGMAAQLGANGAAIGALTQMLSTAQAAARQDALALEAHVLADTARFEVCTSGAELCKRTVTDLERQNRDHEHRLRALELDRRASGAADPQPPQPAPLMGQRTDP